MRRRPETVAWIVIWISFGIFLVSCGALVGGAAWYRSTASEALEATVTGIQGTVLTSQHGRALPVSSGSTVELREGDTIRTDPSSRALITFFDNSTLIVWPGSEVILSTMRRSRFLPRWDTVEVTQISGKTRVGVAPTVDAQSSFFVRALQSRLTLQDGSYAVEVDSEGAGVDVAVRDGRARVEAAQGVAQLSEGQRVHVPRDGPPGAVVAAARELVRNGDFSQGLEGWEWGNVDVADGSPAGRVQVVNDGDAPSLAFERSGSKGAHAETRVVQTIERDVSDYLSLIFSMRIKITRQSLGGGGFMGSEYPVMVQVKYRGVDGGDWTWLQGFYAENTEGNRTTNGEKVDGGRWVQISRELMAADVSPRPAYIVWIKVSASGHDYESQVSQVSLAGE